MDGLKNVYVERREKDGYVVLASDRSESITVVDTVIVIHLHYYSMLDYFCKYIDRIPDSVDVYLTSSQEKVINDLAVRYKDRKNIRVIKKENQGRDLSGLLVACRDQLKKYKYVCFVHDKRSNAPYLDEDVHTWIDNLWENTVASEHYIKNVFEYFCLHQKCGLLLPPEAFGNYLDAWHYGKSWGWDYEITEKLASQLHINANLSCVYPPIAIGSAFWARMKALEKLFDYEWKYEDFCNEPMPYDGTISHAIERILPYVAQDAGYESKTVMTNEFCPKLLSHAQYTAFLSSQFLIQSIGIFNVWSPFYLRHKRNLIHFFEEYENVYLYGAGNGGRECLNFCILNNLFPVAFVVTKRNSIKKFRGLPVMEFEDVISEDENPGFIVSMIEEENVKAVVRVLTAHNIDDYFIWKKGLYKDE